MKIQWFPGHIAKARRDIKENLKLVDIVIEVIDARCPLSSINFLGGDIKNKKHFLIVNKIDLADEKRTNELIKNYIKLNHNNISYIFLDSRKNDINKIIDKKIADICNDILLSKQNKGINNFKLKAMVVGMPNVGKSTFINSYVKKKVNNVANTPGVTKSLNWTKISDKLLLLDTPGVTTPKFENEKVGINLALIGSINDNIVEKQDLVYEFVSGMKSKYFSLFKNRYKLVSSNENSETLSILNEIADNMKLYKKGMEIDYEKVSNTLLSDFRKGLLGRITLE